MTEPKQSGGAPREKKRGKPKKTRSKKKSVTGQTSDPSSWHPLRRVRYAIGEAMGKNKISKAELGKFMGLTSPKIDSIERRARGEARSKFSHESAEKLFHATGAVLWPYVAFKGTKAEIRPTENQALTIGNEDYTPDHYRAILDCQRPVSTKVKSSDSGAVKMSKRAMAQIHEGRRSLMLELIDALLCAASEEGRFPEVREMLWRIAEKARKHFKLDDAISEAMEKRNTTREPIPISELGEHPYFRHLSEKTGGGNASENQKSFQAMIRLLKEKHGPNAMVRVPQHWPSDLADGSPTSNAIIDASKEQHDAHSKWGIEISSSETDEPDFFPLNMT